METRDGLMPRALFLAKSLGCLSLLLCGRPLSADSLALRGGEKLIGRVLFETNGIVAFDSQNLGRMDVPRERIENIALDPAPPPASTTAVQPPTAASWSSLATNQFIPWITSASGPDNYDWIQLKSGEWLKGRMKSLQNDTLEFDSDKLDLQEFDWKDIYTIRLPRLNGVRLETLGEINGRVLVTTNQVVVEGDTTNTYPRSELVSVTPTGNRERNKWSGDISAGLAFRAGNTKQTDFNAQVDVDRRTPSTHYSLDYLGNFGRIDGEETENNHRVTTEFDYFLSRRFFVLAPFAEYYRDPLQNLEHRLTLGSGVGYDLVKNHRAEWSLQVGPAYQENWYTSVSEDEAAKRGAAAVVLGSKLELELTKRLDLTGDFRAQITRREVGETAYHSLIKFEFEIHKRLKLDLSFIWDRISQPQTDAEGNTPEKDDYRLITGLGLKF